MKSLSTLITAVLMSAAGKIMSALGIAFVSYKGVEALQERFAGWMLQQIGSIPADALNIFYLAGGGIFLNWIFGAIAFSASVKGASKLTAIMKK